MLQEFLTGNRDEIIARTRAKVAGRASPQATENELENGVPLFLNQFIETLGAARSAQDAIGAIGRAAAIHGGKLLGMGFTVAQVVYDYGDICQAITELADETASSITAAEFHTLNRCLDEAIAQAVTAYTNLRERTIVHREHEHYGEVAHEMRIRLSATMLSFDLLRKGSVGIAGSTGAALGRGLSGLRSFLDGAFARVRLDSGIRQPERIPISRFLEAIAADASIAANVRGVKISVATPDADVAVLADRQLLHAAVSRLMQSAIEYSPPQGRAWLRSIATGDRVLIDIHDECGGLPPGKAEAFFRPVERPVEQRGMVGAEPGLGFSVVRACVAAIGGTARVRDMPDVGCVFTIDLQRLPQA